MNKLIQKLLVLLAGATGSAFGMEVSVVNPSDWDVEISYKNAGGTEQKKIIDKKETTPVVLGNIDDITELTFKGLHDKGALGWLASFAGSPIFDGQSGLENIKANEKIKYKYKNEYSVQITIKTVRQNVNVLEWKVPFTVNRLPLKQIYNPQFIVMNASDEEMEFTYKLAGNEKNIKIPTKSKAILGDARTITDLKSVKPADKLQDSLETIIEDYDEDPSELQKINDLFLELSFDNNDEIKVDNWGMTPAIKALPILRPGKSMRPKIDRLPVITKAGGHQIAIRNSTEQEITVDYKTGFDAYIPKKIAPFTYEIIDKADTVTHLSLHTKGHGSYDATELLNNSKNLVKVDEPQYVIFSVHSTGGMHKGSGQTHNKWVVRAHVDTYETVDGKVSISRKFLTMKHGGRIKQK